MKAHRKVSGLICSPGGSESATEFLLLWSLDRFRNKDLRFCDADDAINHMRTFQRFSHVFVAPSPPHTPHTPKPPTRTSSRESSFILGMHALSEGRG